MPTGDSSNKTSNKPEDQERDMKPLLFDPEWYLRQHADVARARLDPAQHYLEYGAKEGRNPNPFFDTKRYLAANPDVRASPLNPFLHFVLYGFREGRNPSPVETVSPQEPKKAPSRRMAAPALPEPPTEEKLRQTLLNALRTAAAEAGETDSRTGKAPMTPAQVPSKPPQRAKPRARKKP